ncbi:MAG: hypothetical protein J07HQW1_02425 [Haloquadratum walsbyi J07HQW1]|uniref:Uncharacterized protein n=1 Tax=Haloquadratum walsbyi J07HQW1 TaxID=1238424 RepID=U1N7E8_9EURY|nr:MAG: hypothetical protein J07HQW1_02425 [Haloquadratum walsbyi J07HQW1]
MIVRCSQANDISYNYSVNTAVINIVFLAFFIQPFPPRYRLLVIRFRYSNVKPNAHTGVPAELSPNVGSEGNTAQIATDFEHAYRCQ